MARPRRRPPDVGRGRRDRRRALDHTARRRRRRRARAGSRRDRAPQGGRPARRHGLHLSQPGSVDRPAAGGGRCEVDHRRRPAVPAPRRARAPRRCARRGSPVTPGSTTTPRCAPACARSRCGIRRAGHKAVVFADDNSIVDREVAYRAGLGWFGKNANLLLPGAGSYFVLGCIVTTAEYPPGEPRRRRLRHVPALPRRLPDRRDRRARRRRRQPVPGVAGAEAGHVPGRVPRGARRPAVRVRRLPGGVPARGATRRVRASTLDHGASDDEQPQAWVDVLDCSTPPTSS